MTVWERANKLVEAAPFRRRRWYLVATTFVAFGLAFVLLKPLLSARWSLIDDHETLAIYDNSPTHGPSWFLDELRHSETLGPGASSRFRPAYYFFRIAETGLWHGSSRLWWLSHVVQFALALLFLLWALRRLTSIWENIAAVVWITGAFTWWGDIFCRLGPSENYVAVGLALYAWGAIAAVQTLRSGQLPRYHRWSGAALAIGGCIAAGSKETMLFLLLPSMCLVVCARWRGSRRWITAGSAIHLVFGIFVTIAAYVGVARHGHVYRADTSSGARLDYMASWFRSVVLDHWPAIVIGGAVVGGALLAAKTRRRVLARSLAMPAAMCLFALIVWLSQIGLYNTWPPQIPRYSFPGALANPVVLYVCYIAAIRIARFYDVRAAVVLRVAVLLLAVWRLFHLDYSVHAQAALMKKTSTEISSKIRRVTKAAKANPTSPIVMVSNTPMASEAVASLQAYLRHAHVTNPVYMIQRFAPADFPQGSLERAIADEMEAVTREGGKGTGNFPLTRPFAYQADGGACIGIGVGGGTGLKECPALAIF